MTPARVLLVEDSPSDVLMATAALHEAGVENVVDVVRDGEAAMAFLRREAPYADAGRPDLVLLDLNLPRRDGREVLADLDADHLLSDIPVVVLSTSSAESDVYAAYALHANGFLTKPQDFLGFVAVMRGAAAFWLDPVRRADLAAHLALFSIPE